MKAIIIVLSLTVFLWAEEKEKTFEYIGSQGCKTCHKSSKKGAQYKAWEEGPHSGALETLKSEEAAKVAKEMKLELPAYEAPECLSCHATGYGNGGFEVKNDKFYAETTKKGKPTKDVKRMTGLQGVGCESCHGAGKEYKKSHKKDYELALTQGLIMPTKEVCVTCHNKKSPTFTEFKFEEMYKQIAHPFPKDMERKNRK
ncbi:MAG: cytochrome c family protein [Candidatus Marinimicrobia bacterium]|nr:cytochrome c family protein [Candidatus Neomarinimicrobiota bacterium]MBL7023579.1 cytochrome c family protein [Candidatus Neomarinimicrobiota bacterium]MBL7110061.1 cytochrome c family protein [Candidatus Neomarinimicrobiota bacterium]